MKALVAVGNPVVRDQIRVALQGFEDVEAYYEIGVAALDKARRRDFDAAILGIELQQQEGEDLLDALRGEFPDLEIVTVAQDTVLQELKTQKARRRLFACLKQPLEPVEFFRTISRLRRQCKGAVRR